MCTALGVFFFSSSYFFFDLFKRPLQGRLTRSGNVRNIITGGLICWLFFFRKDQCVRTDNKPNRTDDARTKESRLGETESRRERRVPCVLSNELLELRDERKPIVRDGGPHFGEWRDQNVFKTLRCCKSLSSCDRTECQSTHVRLRHRPSPFGKEEEEEKRTSLNLANVLLDAGRLLLLFPTLLLPSRKQTRWLFESWKCFFFFVWNNKEMGGGASRQRQIDKATNNKREQERDKRTRHIFDIKLLRCWFLRVFFSYSSLWRHSFKGTKESKFVGQDNNRKRKKERKMGEKSRNGTEKKRWQKCRHHTRFFLLLFSVNWLRHRPLLLSFSLSSTLLVCLFSSHKINNVSPIPKLKKKGSLLLSLILYFLSAVYLFCRWNDSEDRYRNTEHPPATSISWNIVNTLKQLPGKIPELEDDEQTEKINTKKMLRMSETSSGGGEGTVFFSFFFFLSRQVCGITYTNCLCSCG